MGVSHLTKQYLYWVISVILQSIRVSELSIVDPLGSVLGSLDRDRNVAAHYSPFGHSRDRWVDRTAYIGQWREKQGGYLLGNGRRAFSPTLMRFSQPDRHSPFGKGGFNAYAYCEGQPITKIDPTGCNSRLKTMLGMSIAGAGIFGMFTTAALARDKKQPILPVLTGIFTATAIVSGIGGHWHDILKAQPGIRNAVESSASLVSRAQASVRSTASRISNFPVEFYDRRGGVSEFLYGYNPFNGPYVPRNVPRNRQRLTGHQLPVGFSKGYITTRDNNHVVPAGGAYVEFDQIIDDRYNDRLVFRPMSGWLRI